MAPLLTKGVMIIKTICLMRLFCGLISLCLFLSSAAEAKSAWTNIRIIVYENRSVGKQPDCSTQHIREHIYARLIHKSLDDQRRWPFVVNAKSTIDKIIISVGILANSTDRFRIVSELERGLKSNPSRELIASELQLVAIEEKAVLARPPLSERFLTQLSKTFGQKLISDCETMQFIETGDADFGSDIGRYQIVFLDRAEMPNVALDVSNHSSIMFENRGIYSSPVMPVFSKNIAGSEPSSDALYIGLSGSQNVDDHIVLIARIADSARKIGMQLPEIRPFGIGAFVVMGRNEELSALHAELTSVSKTDMSDPLKRALLTSADRWARNYFCSIPTKKLGDINIWADAVVDHPYFLFWLEAPECKNKNSGGWQSRAELYTRLPDIHLEFLRTNASQNPAYKVANLKYSMCLKNDGKSQLIVDKKIYFEALRQYFRMDLGLVLDIREKDIESNCSTIGFIAPFENHILLKKVISEFDINNPTMLRRISGAKLEALCRQEIDEKCHDEASHVKERISNHFITFRPL